jgi:hypothetical protein
MSISYVEAFAITLNKDIVIVKFASGSTFSLSNFFTAATFSSAPVSKNLALLHWVNSRCMYINLGLSSAFVDINISFGRFFGA